MLILAQTFAAQSSSGELSVQSQQLSSPTKAYWPCELFLEDARQSFSPVQSTISVHGTKSRNWANGLLDSTLLNNSEMLLVACSLLESCNSMALMVLPAGDGCSLCERADARYFHAGVLMNTR